MMHTEVPWRLLTTPPLPGATNMALDQALTEFYPLHSRPILRFYRWSPSSVSIGYAQRFARDVNQTACQAWNVDIVRRPTGGRAVLHDQEVTYALILGVDHPIIGSRGIVQSYRVIGEALRAGLTRLGVPAEPVPVPVSQRDRSPACFDRTGDYELAVGGRKLVGSAQARSNGVLLQHGSILLHADTEKLARVLRLPASLTSSVLERRLIALDEVLGRLPSFDEVVTALVQGFEQTWHIQLSPDELTLDERERAHQLVREKYGNPAWTQRR